MHTSDVICFLDNMTKLERCIENIYGTESEMTKIQICLNQQDESIRDDGEFVFHAMQEEGIYDLGEFLRRVFKLSFPASQTSMQASFRTLTQSNPEKISVTDYARKFRTLVRLLDMDISKQIDRFIDGLTSPHVRMTLRGHPLQGLGFPAVVSHAIQIQAGYSAEKGSVGKSMFVSEEPAVYKVMEVPFTRYVEEAKCHNVGDRCYNCLARSHQANQCRLLQCKFCDKPTAEAGHYSLLCRRAPKSFEKFLEARGAQKSKVEAARYAIDFSDYHFD